MSALPRKLPQFKPLPHSRETAAKGKPKPKEPSQKADSKTPKKILEFDRNSQIFWNLLALKRFLDLMQNLNFEEIFQLIWKFLNYI